MAKYASKLLVLSFVLAFLASIFVPKAFASNSKVIAITGIERAENVLVSAFQAVLAAEQVGANVSDLLAQLNEAGEFLAEAHMVYRLEDFDEATRFADLCYDVGERVRSLADELRVEAYGSRTMGFWLTMTGSLVGVVAVVFGSFWGWRLLKRHFYRRGLRMKPKVAKDES